MQQRNCSKSQSGQRASSHINTPRALAAANPAAGETVEIWIKAGTYSSATGETFPLTMKNNVGIFGGFAGTEVDKMVTLAKHARS